MPVRIRPAFICKYLFVRLILIACLSAAPSFSHGQSVTVGQKVPANVFVSPQTPEFPLAVNATSVKYTVRDFWDEVVLSGELDTAGKSTATLAFDPGRLGYFKVTFQATLGTTTAPPVEVTTAVLHASSPTPSADTAFGIVTHFSQGWDLEIMDLVPKAGIGRIRDEAYWDTVEASPNTFDFPDRFTNYISRARSLGLDPLLALTFGNPNYDGGYTPYTDLGRAGYAEYARQVVSRYQSEVSSVEIWNEYNGTFCSGPATNDRPTFYTSMLQQAFAEVRQERPEVKVGGGAAVLVPISWFTDLFDQGALDSMDAVVMHPYRGVPEGVETEVAELRELIRSKNANVEKPIWVTECGGDSADPGRQSMARYLVRLITLLRSEQVERVYWYLLKDSEHFVTGLLYGDDSKFGKNSPSSAYPAYSVLISQLDGATIVGRETTDPRTRLYRFAKGAQQVRVVWSIAGESTLQLQTTSPLVITDIMGNQQTLNPVNGYVTVPVTIDPSYITGPVSSVQEDGRDVLLADSTLGYSGVQGLTNGTWSYGYEIGSGAFQNLTWTATDYGFRWLGAPPYIQLRIDNVHPSVSGGQPVNTIRRWRSDSAGPIVIHGMARRSSPGGDGTGIQLRVDGVTCYTRTVGPSRDDVVEFTVRANVKVGSLIDFVVTPGPGAEINFDAIDYSYQISQPFTPGDAAGADWEDFDYDGVSNLLETALGSDHRRNDRALSSPGQSLVREPDGKSFLHYQYRKLQAASGLTYQMEYSDNLTTWKNALGTTTSGSDNGDGTVLMDYRDDADVTVTPPRYLRLKVNPPAP